MKTINQKNAHLVALGYGFSLLVPMLGLFYLGPLYAGLFVIGYVGGWIFWIGTKASASWRAIRAPYWATMVTFLLLHKLEENRTGFFEAVSLKITKTSPPEISFGLIVALLIIPLAAWLAIPFLMRRGNEFGRYLAWTFFASMGLTELAHFAMPILANEPFYFPGMASVVILAPLGWWGMARLVAPPAEDTDWERASL